VIVAAVLSSRDSARGRPRVGLPLLLDAGSLALSAEVAGSGASFFGDSDKLKRNLGRLHSRAEFRHPQREPGTTLDG